MADEQEILNRWRLVLGKYAADQIPFEGGSLKMMDHMPKKISQR